MTPPNDPPSNPYDPNWPKPETPPSNAGSEPTPAPPTQPYGQQPSSETAPYAPYGQDQPYGQPSQPAQPSWGQPAQPSWGQPSQPEWGQSPTGQAPYGQAPYGQAPYGQVPYGAPTYGGGVPQAHPSATTAMILGIGALGGMFFCGLPIVLAPFAWMVGGRAVKEIDANPGRYSGRDQAQAGRIMGMIGTGLLALFVVGIIAVIGLAVAGSNSGDLNYDSDSGYSDSSF